MMTYLVRKNSNVEALVSGMARIGYELVENWEAKEMRQLVSVLSGVFCVPIFGLFIFGGEASSSTR